MLNRACTRRLLQLQHQVQRQAKLPPLLRARRRDLRVRITVGIIGLPLIIIMRRRRKALRQPARRPLLHQQHNKVLAPKAFWALNLSPSPEKLGLFVSLLAFRTTRRFRADTQRRTGNESPRFRWVLSSDTVEFIAFCSEFWPKARIWHAGIRLTIQNSTARLGYRDTIRSGTQEKVVWQGSCFVNQKRGHYL